MLRIASDGIVTYVPVIKKMPAIIKIISDESKTSEISFSRFDYHFIVALQKHPLSKLKTLYQ